jgi:DNA repair exonuclease SbcCD ATPase subunit
MVVDEIRELLAAPDPQDAEPFLARLDATLTAGYAHALQLEAERWRLERRIGEVAAELARETSVQRAEELASLSRRLSTANAEIASLRGLLTSLRDKRSEVRTAA